MGYSLLLHTQIHTHVWHAASTSFLSPLENMSTSPSSPWMSIARKHVHHMIILRWGMAVHWTLHWWEDSVEMAAMSLLLCKPPKATWQSGEGGEHVILPQGLSYNSFFHRFASNYWDNGLGFQIGYNSINGTPQMTYRIGECGGSFTTPNGILTSPSYPFNYPYNADCVYTISQPSGTAIVLTFHSMDIENHSTCRWDYLEIRDGSSAASPLLGKLCGTEIPVPIQSTQNQVWMKWGQTVCNLMTLL